MSTRLTNAAREAIVHSAMAATNWDAQRKAFEEKVKKTAADFIRSQQPKEWAKFITGKPKEWFKQQAHLACHWEKNPLHVLSEFHRYQIPLDDTISIAIEVGQDGSGQVFAKLYAEAVRLKAQRDDAQSALVAFLRSQNTVESLIKAMPEIAKHVPKSMQVQRFPLVAPSNALSMLAKLGFDRTVDSKA